MNNSFARLIDGMNATLRGEVLPRLDDEFARGQVFGVINLLNTFKVRADWSAGFLREQIAAQETALDAAAAATGGSSLPADVAPVPSFPARAAHGDGATVEALLSRRDANNRAIGAWLAWLDGARSLLPAKLAATLEQPLRRAMRTEVDLELRNSPRPLFAEMSSGREE